MRSTSLAIILTLALALVSVSAWAYGNGHGHGGQQSSGSQGGNGGGNGSGNGGGGLISYLQGLPMEDLSDAELAGLEYMAEEEKLARDLYLALGELWGTAVFSNIARSEQRHMDAVALILGKYGAETPEDPGTGVFDSQDMQELYNTLLEAGSASLAAAFRVGATVEDLDIADLKDHLASADNEDILALYQNLMKGSRNHLRAFSSQLSLTGEEYEAQYLSADEVDAIISSPMERGLVDSTGVLVSR